MENKKRKNMLNFLTIPMIVVLAVCFTLLINGIWLNNFKQSFIQKNIDFGAISAKIESENFQTAKIIDIPLNTINLEKDITGNFTIDLNSTVPAHIYCTAKCCLTRKENFIDNWNLSEKIGYYIPYKQNIKAPTELNNKTEQLFELKNLSFSTNNVSSNEQADYLGLFNTSEIAGNKIYCNLSFNSNLSSQNKIDLYEIKNLNNENFKSTDLLSSKSVLQINSGKSISGNQLNQYSLHVEILVRGVQTINLEENILEVKNEAKTQKIYEYLTKNENFS